MKRTMYPCLGFMLCVSALVLFLLNPNIIIWRVGQLGLIAMILVGILLLNLPKKQIRIRYGSKKIRGKALVTHCLTIEPLVRDRVLNNELQGPIFNHCRVIWNLRDQKKREQEL